MTPLGQAAIALGARGLRVFPCWPRKKEPAIRDNLRLAAVDETIVRRFWGEQGVYNIGVATGPGSGVWVLDIDGWRERTLSRLEAEHGAMPPTVEAISGAGRHLYFRWPDGAEIRNSQDRVDIPGLDVRGDGGYVLAPPSVHPSGRAYCWSVDSASAFADAPRWLIDLAAKDRGGRAMNAATPGNWRSFVNEPVEGSHRGHAVARLYGLLVRKYVDPVVALDIVRMFNELRSKPPLDDPEVVRIANAIADREADRRSA